MKIKKYFMGLIAGLLLASMVYALTLGTPLPANGATLNSDSQMFKISTSVNTAGLPGWVIITNATGGNPSYPLVCYATQCNNTVNLADWPSLDSYNFYFFINGTASSTYSFTMNRPPTQIVGLAIMGNNETSLVLDWNDLNLTETDIKGYRVYRSNVTGFTPNSTNRIANETTLTTNTYTDNGLTTGETYYYVVSAVDLIGQEGPASIEEGQIVADQSPPIAPTFSPPTGSTVNATNPVINTSYVAGGENVTLKIMSGGIIIKTFASTDDFFTWQPFLNNGSVYTFEFNASDIFGNWRSDAYTITTTDAASISFDIVEVISMTTTTFGVKTAVLPGDWIIIGVNFSGYNGSFLRARMDDLVSPTDVIDIPTDTNPILFCAEDYDAGTQDIVAVPSKNVYDILNAYDELQAAIDCADTNPTATTEYTAYIKIPIPASVDSGGYASDLSVAMYDDVI